ncbi:MAG: hypothetical protein ACI4P3_02880, partial [Candidatus Spyradosoma sp.]
KVAVVPFDDFRDERNSNKAMMYLIPLWPFGYIDYERVDAAAGYLTLGQYICTPSEDLPKATATSLRRSGLFSDAFFTMGGEKDRADLILTGEIFSMKYSGTMYSYGLSIFGPYLWVFGAPAGKSHNMIDFSLHLKNHSGEEVWSWNSYKRKHSITQGLYYNLGKDCIGFSRLYQEAMNAALRDLEKTIRANPKRFN